MNKTISYITSLVVVLGLGVLYAFGKLDGTTFGTVSATVLALVWGLYKKYEAGVLKTKVVYLQEKVFDSEFEVTKLKNLNTSLVTALKESNSRFEEATKKSNISTSVVIEPITEVPVTKRKRK